MPDPAVPVVPAPAPAAPAPTPAPAPEAAPAPAPAPAPEPAAAPDPGALHDAAILAVQAWQDKPSPEAKLAAEKAVADAKGAYEASRKTWEANTAAPDAYKLTMPKEAVLAPEELEKVSAFAKELKLTNAQAQALLENRNAMAAGFVAAQKAQNEEAKTAWLKAAQTDPEIGGDKLKAVSEGSKRVLDAHAPEELKTFLVDTGLGNNPLVLKFLNNVFKSVAEDTLIKPGGGPTEEKKEKTRAEIFFGGDPAPTA